MEAANYLSSDDEMSLSELRNKLVNDKSAEKTKLDFYVTDDMLLDELPDNVRDELVTFVVQEMPNDDSIYFDNLDGEDSLVGIDIEIDDVDTDDLNISLLNQSNITYFNDIESDEFADGSGSEYEPPIKYKTCGVNADTTLSYSSDSCNSSDSCERVTNARKRIPKETETVPTDKNVETGMHSYSKVTIQSEMKRLSRKRMREPEKWKQNIRKRRRQHGMDYVNTSGKRIPMRKTKDTVCKCKHKCGTKFTTTEREELFHKYWTIDHAQQRSYILHHVNCIDKKRATKDSGKSRRANTYAYYLPLNNTKLQVCKQFFLNSLGIGEKTVHYCVKRKTMSDTKDNRGGNKRTNIPQIDKEFIKKHIEEFPTVDSHYCRKDSQKKYLEKNLTVRKMYNMYVKKCENSERSPQKYWIYEKIFNTEYNLAFHVPKKDLCSFCEIYKNLDEEQQQDKRDEYNAHQQRKEDVRTMKDNDKDRARNNQNVKLINFDVQKVLISPKTEVGEAYYSRKLSTYNFTVFDTISKQAKCYMWFESIAKRGSNEISTCMLKYNQSIGNVDHLIYYSDSCTGQQRNLQFSTMCMYSVLNLPINTITHNYLERGHSQMEGDSVHATIEKHTKKSEMFAPSDWFNAVRNSKVNKPRYEVVEITNADILHFTKLASNTVSNRKHNTDGEIVNWKKIRGFQYMKSEPSKIFYRYHHNGDYKCLEITKSNLRGSKPKSCIGCKIVPAYTAKIPISTKKFKDLIKLCDKNVIPSSYHPFYRSLPHTEQNTRLTEPNDSDSSDE